MSGWRRAEIVVAILVIILVGLAVAWVLGPLKSLAPGAHTCAFQDGGWEACSGGATPAGHAPGACLDRGRDSGSGGEEYQCPAPPSPLAP